MSENKPLFPVLGQTPVRHPDCCLSLSHPLLGRIIKATTRGRNDDDPCWRILSIGSGTGLLEHLLSLHARKLNPYAPYMVDGVEVQQPESQPSVNRYLMTANTVQTTSTISPALYEKYVKGLMFVYPRQTTLVRRYLDEFWAGKTHIDTIIWLGPQADWDDFSPCFDSRSPGSPQKPAIQLLSGTEAGLDDYELMAIIRLHRGDDP